MWPLTGTSRRPTKPSRNGKVIPYTYIGRSSSPYSDSGRAECGQRSNETGSRGGCNLQLRYRHTSSSGSIFPAAGIEPADANSDSRRSQFFITYSLARCQYKRKQSQAGARPPETIDGLDIGQIRAVISNSLFPGTFVLHAGASYLLLVSWAYQTAAAGTSRPDILKSKRALIDRLGEISTTGFIGSSAGNRVRQFRSAACWPGLRRYEIVHLDIDRARMTETMSAALPNSGGAENFEAAIWPPTLSGARSPSSRYAHNCPGRGPAKGRPP